MQEHFKRAHPGGYNDGVKVNPSTNHFHCKHCGLELLTKYPIDNHVCLGNQVESQCPVCFFDADTRLELLKHLQDHGEKLDEMQLFNIRLLFTSKTLIQTLR